MRVSSDLIFLGKDKKVVIYNYFINRAIMVNKDSAHFIKYNMGKCIETNMIVDENLKILKKNGVIIENEKELIIPELSEPPVRTLGATIPENESHIFR